jgi:MFS family permease
MLKKIKQNSLFLVYFLGFLFSLQVALPNYINSSYLGTLMSDTLVGAVYTLESIIAIIGFILMPGILNRFGNFRVTIFLFLTELVALLGLVLYQNAISAFLFMTISIATVTFLYFNFDIFLEGFSFDVSTGKTRGIYMTCVNLAWVLGPLLAGMILTNGDYWKVYLSSFLILLPVFVIFRATLNRFKDSEYPQKINPIRTFFKVRKNKNIWNIFLAVFLLQLFFAWMTIYTPIYLHNDLNMNWGEIGIIFAIMLLPFIFVQFPAGKLADLRFGEKEMLSIGFAIMALATTTMFFIQGKNILVWSLILLGTRVGAALVEIMCDVYFFKKVDSNNTDLISFFRMAKPLAYIIGPLLATIILTFGHLEIKNLFLILGFIMLFGIRYSLAINDTK